MNLKGANMLREFLGQDFGETVYSRICIGTLIGEFPHTEDGPSIEEASILTDDPELLIRGLGEAGFMEKGSVPIPDRPRFRLVGIMSPEQARSSFKGAISPDEEGSVVILEDLDYLAA